MKKLLLTFSVVAIGVSAFGQGQVIFGSAAGYVWNTNSIRAAAGTVDTAFLFSTVNVAPTIAGVQTSTPTNSPAQFTVAQGTTIWSDILSDPIYKIATNSATGLTVIGTTTAMGGISYNSGSSFLALNTPAGGGNIYVYVIAWDSVYGTP